MFGLRVFVRSLSAMPRMVALPYQARIEEMQLNAIATTFPMERFDEAHELYHNAALQGDGYTIDEVGYDVLKKRFQNSPVVCFMNEQNNELMSVLPFHDSPVCRSNKAFLCAVFSMVNPKYRGRGVGREQYKLAIKYSTDLGYFGVNARAVLSGKNLVPTRAVGSIFTGLVPYASLLEKVGYMDDVLIYRDYNLHQRAPHYYEMAMQARNKPLPPLIAALQLPLKTTETGDEGQARDYQTTEGLVHVRPAVSREDIWHVETMLRTSANQGKGFGLDEFDKDGCFNKKFFKESNMVVAEDKHGEIAGAAIYGLSVLSRGMDRNLASSYVVVDPAKHRKGLGKVLLSHTLDILKEKGYQGCVGDTYINNHSGLELLRKYKFLFTGSMPMCAYVKGAGPMDSIVAYKQLS